MGQEKIIIAEDEARVAQALRRALSMPEGGGYQVETYESGEEALTRLAESHFDLLITDYRMPGMTGLDLLGKCREVSPATSSILITGFGSPQIEEKAYQLAVDAYLPKPFSMNSLVRAVRDTLKRKNSNALAQRLTDFTAEGSQQIQQRMKELREDVGARDVLLFDHAGQLFAKSGRQNEFDTGTFLALLGNAMVATNAVSNVLGDQEAFDLNFHEGKKYETYTARVSDQVFLAVVLDKQGNNSRIGMVWLYLRRAITDLRSLLVGAKVKTDSGLNEGMKNALKDTLEETLRLDELTPGAIQSSPNRRVPGADEGDAIKKSLEEAINAAESSPVPPPQQNVSADDHNAVISYEQAKRLGLFNSDNT